MPTVNQASHEFHDEYIAKQHRIIELLMENAALEREIHDLEIRRLTDGQQ